MIAYPSVNRFLKQAEDTYYEDLEKNVSLVAMDLTEDNRGFLPDVIGESNKITIDQIVEYGELEQITDKVGNPCDDGYVLIEKRDTNDYCYTSCLVCGAYQTDNARCEKYE